MRMQLATGLGVLGCLFGAYGCESDAQGIGGAAGATKSEQACSGGLSRSLDPNTRFYAPDPRDEAVMQIKALHKSHNREDAQILTDLVRTPHAVWFTGGTPQEVKSAVQQTMRDAERSHRVPVLVAYNVPYRDCSQYSAGGAADTAEYQAWIDSFAEGIGRGKAVVIVEPDGLGIIPYNTTIYGSAEWCKPTVTDADGGTLPAPGATADERYTQINYAVDSIEAHAPKAAAYLDASHSAWLGVGEAAYRLVKAGVRRAQGFYLNVSNYQLTSDNIQFGTWISDAIAASSGAPAWAFDENGKFHFDWLPSQYDPATNYSTVNYSADFVASVTAGLQSFMGSAVATTHFVIDTSRNGQGPLNTAPYSLSPYNQTANVVNALSSGNWCNPPGAGAGLRPSADTGVALLDAYLWVKVPGESDGSCDIAGGARAWDYSAYNPWGVTDDVQTHFDPLWGLVDPAAGGWFGAQALQLAQNANPALR